MNPYPSQIICQSYISQINHNVVQMSINTEMLSHYADKYFAGTKKKKCINGVIKPPLPHKRRIELMIFSIYIWKWVQCISTEGMVECRTLNFCSSMSLPPALSIGIWCHQLNTGYPFTFTLWHSAVFDLFDININSGEWERSSWHLSLACGILSCTFQGTLIVCLTRIIWSFPLLSSIHKKYHNTYYNNNNK